MANVAPLAPTLTSPPNNSYAIVSEPNEFEWTFNDPGDVQSYYYFRYKKAGDAGWTTTAAILSPVCSHTVAANTWVQPFAYEWQVQTLDNMNASSPWSGSRFVNMIDTIPAPTITAPAAAAVIAATPVTVEWTVDVGFTQDAYQITAVSTAGTLYDSGVVEQSAARSALVPLPAGSGPVDLDVRLRYNDHWSGEPGGVTVTNAISAPHTPTLICFQVPGEPVVTVGIYNEPASGGYVDAVSNDLFRDGFLIATGLPVDGTFTDRMVGAGLVDYTVLAYAASGGSTLGGVFLDTFVDTFVDVFGTSESA